MITIPSAHIMGVPVEETLGTLGPGLGAVLGGLVFTLRSRRESLRRAGSRANMTRFRR